MWATICRHCCGDEFLKAEGCASIDMYRRIAAEYDGVYPNVRRWTRTVKSNNPFTTNLHDHARSGRLITTTDTQHLARAVERIRVNRRVKQKGVVVLLGNSSELVNHTLSMKCLGIGKCVSHILCHRKRSNADSRCFRNFGRKMNLKAMSLSAELSMPRVMGTSS